MYSKSCAVITGNTNLDIMSLFHADNTGYVEYIIMMIRSTRGLPNSTVIRTTTLRLWMNKREWWFRMCIGAHVFHNTILIDNSILRQPSRSLTNFYIWPYGASAEKEISTT